MPPRRSKRKRSDEKEAKGAKDVESVVEEKKVPTVDIKEEIKEAKAARPVGEPTLLDEWRRENIKKMLAKAKRPLKLQIELQQLEMQEAKRSPHDINDMIESMLEAGVGEDIDPQKERYARQALESIQKYNGKEENFEVWAKKISDALQGAVEDKVKVTLALTRLEDDVRELVIHTVKEETWQKWKTEAAAILQPERNIHERLATVRGLTMSKDEAASDFVNRYIRTLGRLGIWEQMSEDQKYGDLVQRTTPKIRSWFRKDECRTYLGAIKSIKRREEAKDDQLEDSEGKKTAPKIPTFAQTVLTITCENCGKVGHSIEKCWQIKDNKGENPNSPSDLEY